MKGKKVKHRNIHPDKSRKKLEEKWLKERREEEVTGHGSLMWLNLILLIVRCVKCEEWSLEEQTGTGSLHKIKCSN